FARLADGKVDGGGAISFGLVLHAGTLQADHGVVDDGKRVFATGIVGGKDDEITASARSFAHKRPLGAVAISAAAKHGDHAPAAWLRKFARERCQINQGIVGVRIVDHDGEGLAAVHAFETSRHAEEVPGACSNVSARATASVSRCGGSQNVVCIHSAN